MTVVTVLRRVFERVLDMIVYLQNLLPETDHGSGTVYGSA